MIVGKTFVSWPTCIHFLQYISSYAVFSTTCSSSGYFQQPTASQILYIKQPGRFRIKWNVKINVRMMPDTDLIQSFFCNFTKFLKMNVLIIAWCENYPCSSPSRLILNHILFAPLFSGTKAQFPNSGWFQCLSSPPLSVVLSVFPLSSPLLIPPNTTYFLLFCDKIPLVSCVQALYANAVQKEAQL